MIFLRCFAESTNVSIPFLRAFFDPTTFGYVIYDTPP